MSTHVLLRAGKWPDTKGSPLSLHAHPPDSRSVRSQSGAFDLPSILVGVVVVGILTAGVLAAIFGVIPWAQDRSAKQDLAAINTAQGVTFAKDGQTYKDLTGLVDAKLVSGLNPEKSTVTVSQKGKGFAASVKSGSGTTWCITNEDTDPTECVDGGEPGGPLLAVGFCTSKVMAEFEYGLAQYEGPLYLNWKRWAEGIPGYESQALYADEYYAQSGSGLQDDMAAEELYSFRELAGTGRATWPASHLEWESFAPEAARQEREAIREACKTYAGPTPYGFDRHSSVQEWGQYTAVAGSNDPIRVGFTFPFGDANSFDFTFGADRIAGYKSHDVEFDVVDGKPLWTLVLHPVAEGWGHKATEERRSYTFGTSIEVKRKGSTQRPGGWGFSIELTSPAITSHPSKPWETDNSGTAVLRGKSGSKDPIVFGFTTPGISNPENLRTAPENPAGSNGGVCSGFAEGEYNTAGIVKCYDIPGFDRGEAKSHGLVDGKHYYTYTMWPGESGWGAPGETRTEAFRNYGPMMNGTEVPVKVILE